MTTPALEQPMDVPTSDDADRLAAAMAKADEIDTAEATPTQGAPAEETAKPDEPAADDLAAIAEKAAAARAARQSAEQQRQQTEAQSKRESEERAEARALLELARVDPLAFLEKMGHDPTAHYERLTAQAVKGDTVRLQDQLAAAAAKIEALEQRLETRDKDAAQREQQAARQADEHRYITEVRTDAYPLFALFDDDVLLHEGYKIADLYRDAGEKYDNARIARALHSKLQSRLDAKQPSGTGAAVTPKVNGDRSAASQPPRTLTAALASQSATPQDDDSEEARIRRALRVAEQQGL